jgi:RimJ/RimL family protein N-acetyltransferase
MPSESNESISLRPTLESDLEAMFVLQADPIGCALAGTKPRSRDVFAAEWARNLGDPALTSRVIVQGGVFVGTIGIFKLDGCDFIGYRIVREKWGRGIATRAIGLILSEVQSRPILAHVVAENVASRRALERHGFVVTASERTPETERYLASETLTLQLA